MGVQLKSFDCHPQRGPRADPWLTISGWMLAAYLAGVTGVAAWLFF